MNMFNHKKIIKIAFESLAGKLGKLLINTFFANVVKDNFFESKISNRNPNEDKRLLMEEKVDTELTYITIRIMILILFSNHLGKAA